MNKLLPLAFTFCLAFAGMQVSAENWIKNADGSPYVAEDVPWVSYFYSGYAFHGAGWRSSFGYSGSHGCVNMPVSEAQWIYNWVDTNTVVQSHY